MQGQVAVVCGGYCYGQKGVGGKQAWDVSGFAGNRRRRGGEGSGLCSPRSAPERRERNAVR